MARICPPRLAEKNRDSSTQIIGDVSNGPIISGDVNGNVTINYGQENFEKEGKGKPRSDDEIRDDVNKYISFVRGETESSSNVLGKSRSLNDYYVEQDGLFIAKGGSKVWTNEDSYFNSPPPYEDGNYKGKIKEIVERELLNPKDLWYLLVGASFGVGTSTLARWLAYEYANAYSVKNIHGNDQIHTTHYENDINCIPIFHSLRKGSVLRGAIYRQRELDNLLKEIIVPSLKLKPASILLILDGVNQLNSKEIIELKEEIAKMHDDYPTLKVLLLSKTMVFPEEASDLVDKFVRLLPFDDKQAQEYYFGKVRRLQGLDYDQMKITYGEEIVLKPLFASMIFLIHEGDTEGNLQTVRLMDERSEMKRIALIYMCYLARISETKYGPISYADNWNRRKWFRIIRAVAAFSHIHKDNDKDKTTHYEEILRMLTEEELYNPQDEHNPQAEKLEDILDPLIVIKEDGSVRFVHESFRGYLLATFYIESLLSYNQQENQVDDDDNLVRSDGSDIHDVSGKKKYLNQYNLNIGIPDMSTPVDFLEGILELLLDEEIIGKLVQEYKIDLRDSFGYDRTSSLEIKDRLKENILAILSDPYRVILVLKDALDHNRWVRRWYDNERENIKKCINGKPFKFGNLWIHLWISLFISNKLSYKPPDLFHLEIGKFGNLGQIMVISSNVIPSFLKRLRGIDLSTMKLSGINLDGADLSHANIQGADLRGANLCEAQLVEAKLKGSDLSNAKLCHSFMLGADLSGATMLRADLSGIRLIPKDENSQEYKSADFSNTNLCDANISDAIMCGVDLTNADLYRANLCDTDLSKSKLQGTKLTFANLSYTILHDAHIDKANLSYTNLSEADIAGVNFSSCFSDSKKDNFINVNLSNAKIYEAEPIERLLEYPSQPIKELLVKKFPTDEEKEVLISTYIIASFSKPIRHEEYKFRISKLKMVDNRPQQITNIMGKITKSKDGETIFFKPECPLEYSSTYEVVIEDFKGKDLAKWRFTTATREKDNRTDSGRTTVIAEKEIGNVKVKRGTSHDGNLFDRTLDSEFTTRWSNYGKGSWIIYDLGSKRDICAIDIAWFKGDKRSYDFEILYSISDSNDDNYRHVKPVDPPSLSSRGKTLSPERYTFVKVRAQYVKIIVNGNTQNNWAGITEVAFYECANSSSSS
jgi:uncharacterized protein YjbI with pentapeptide repeats